MDQEINYDSNDLGKVEIAPEVIQIISGLSASQVDGVIGLSGGVVGDINQLLGRKNFRKGIRVNIEGKLSIELSINVQYGYHIPDVGREVQEKVKIAVEGMTGLEVNQVLVRIEGIKLPHSEKAESDGTLRVK